MAYLGKEGLIKFYCNQNLGRAWHLFDDWLGPSTNVKVWLFEFFISSLCCCWRTVPWEIWPGRNVASWYTNEGKLQQIFSVKAIFGKHNDIFYPNLKAISGDSTTDYTDRERQKYQIHIYIAQNYQILALASLYISTFTLVLPKI